MRKFYIIISMLMAGVITMAYVYFSNLNKGSRSFDQSLNIVAAVSGVLFTFENDKTFYDILEGQGILDEVLGSQKSKLLQSIRKNIVQNANINSVIAGEKIYIGFIPGQKDTVDFVIATQTKGKGVEVDKIGKLQNIVIKDHGTYKKLTFLDSTTCYLVINQHAVLLSNSLVAIKKLASTAPTESEFANYIKAKNRFNKNTLASVYLDYTKIPLLLKNILNTNLTGELSIFDTQNTYAALNYNFGSDKLLLNGYTELKDVNSYYQLFVTQKEQKLEVDQLLPDNTANYTLFTIDSYQNWYKDLKNWQVEKNKSQEIEKQFKALNEKYRIDVEETLPKYFEHQFASFQLNTGEKMGIIKLHNGDKLAQMLLDLSTEYAVDIRILNESGLLYGFFGEPFKKFARPYYTIIDNHLVVANTASTVQAFLNHYKQNELLINTPAYLHFKDQISSTATICVYVNQKNSNTIFGRNLKPSYYKQFKSSSGFKDYNAFAYQLSADNGKFMSNVLLLKNQTTTKLDSAAN